MSLEIVDKQVRQSFKLFDIDGRLQAQMINGVESSFAPSGSAFYHQSETDLNFTNLDGH